MSTSRKQKRKQSPRPRPPSPSPSAPDEQPPAPPRPEPSEKKDIWRGFRIGLLCTVLLLALNAVLERTPAGEQFERTGYNLIQLRLSAFRPTDLPVTVVDISDMRPVLSGTGSEAVAVTPRDELRTLLTAVAKEKPRAIGVDIDFSPDENGYITPQDPGFFQFCLDTAQAGTPIILGVKRAESGTSEMWLGSAYYQSLAGDINIAREDPRRLSLWYQAAGVSVPIPTFSAALASISEKHPAAPPGLGWALRLSRKQRPAASFQTGEYWVDFSGLEKLQEDRLLAFDPAAIHAQSERIRGKVVLLGDATLGKSTDTFSIPGQAQPVPGVFVHACGVHTLMSAPLYDLTPLGHALLDVLLSLAVFGTVATLRLHLAGRKGKTVETERLEGLLTAAMVAVVLLVGIGLVSWVRVVWDDFLFVVSGLLLHPYVQRQLPGAGATLAKFATGEGAGETPEDAKGGPDRHPASVSDPQDEALP